MQYNFYTGFLAYDCMIFHNWNMTPVGQQQSKSYNILKLQSPLKKIIQKCFNVMCLKKKNSIKWYRKQNFSEYIYIYKP